MPLTEKVSFTAVLQRGNRIQVPRLIRWQFKLEPDQVLHVRVNVEGELVGGKLFYAKMTRDGRLTIPKLTLILLQERCGKKNLTGFILGIVLEPVTGVDMRKREPVA